MLVIFLNALINNFIMVRCVLSERETTWLFVVPLMMVLESWMTTKSTDTKANPTEQVKREAKGFCSSFFPLQVY